jgi:hypothetical protein
VAEQNDPPSDFKTLTGVYPTPDHLTLSAPFEAHGKTIFFTRHDCKIQAPSAWPARGLTPSPPNGAPHRSQQWMAVTTCERRSRVTIPTGSSGVFVSLEAKYNLMLSNVRVEFRFENGTAFAKNRGGPTTERDQTYNAIAQVHAWGVPPGEYSMVITQSFAEPASVKDLADVCVPMEVDVMMGGDKLGQASVPTQAGPQIVGITPASTPRLDPSDPITVSITTNAAMDVSFKPADKYPVYIVDNVTGAKIKSSGRVYRTEHTLDVRFDAGMLKWYWPYHIEVDPSAIRAKDRTAAAFRSIAVPPTYTTASCSCYQGVCALGGECRCQEVNAQCFSCPSGARLSRQTVRLGPAKGQHKVTHVCEEIATVVPSDLPSTTAGPTAHPGIPTSAPHGNTPPPQVFPTPVDGNPPPAGSTGGTPSPSSPAGGAVRPPLKWMRVLFSATCLMLLIVFSVSRILAFVKRRQRRGHSVNPFRRVAQDEDVEEPGEQFAINSGARSSTAPRGTRGGPAGPHESDDGENDAIV